MTAPAGESVVVALLGEVALQRDGVLTPLPGARSRLLLAALALRPGRSRGAQALITEVWGEQPPRAPMNALHTQVSRLRSALPDGALEIGPAGYRLTLGAGRVDLTLAGELAREAGRRRAMGDFAGCLTAVRHARALWRGEPGADLPSGDLADELRAAAAHRLAEIDALELAARESVGDVDGALRLARHRAAVDPLDEPAQQTLMRLLVGADRANEALESFAAFRSRLAEQLGTDPGSALVALNTAILRGEPVGHANVAPQPAPVRAPASHATGVSRITYLSGELRSDENSAAAAEFQQAVSIGLRAAPNALLGREADLGAIAQLLQGSRVLTVLGPGGAGKTRVANEIGARVAGTRPVVLVELASVRADGTEARIEIEAAIAGVLGLGDVSFDTATLRTRQTPDARQRLRDAVSARSMLLILDNCEHLIDAVAVVVADLIGSADRLTVLATSRAPLMITAETVYPLPPLTIDPAGSPATELFAARAKAVRPGVRLDPDVVARLCHTLDGLPLAIELAAARVRVMSVEEITERLADRFALLRHGDRSSPERHRTLHAVIDWSWNLLDTPQQVALRRLCRFPAGFTLAAAEAVAGGTTVDDVAAAVDGLVNQSLLTVLDHEALGTRYRMLETVREYGEEQLTRSDGEAQSVDTAVMRWAKDYADNAAHRYLTGDQVEWALSVATELDNLLAALRCAVERRDATTAYTVFPIVSVLWAIRGSHTEVISWAARVIDLEPRYVGADAPSPDLVLTTYQMMFVHLAYAGGKARVLARLRLRVRRLLRSRSDLIESNLFIGRVLLVRADGAGFGRLIADAIRSNDPQTRATALLLRANIRENLGDVRGSTVDATRALELFGHDKAWNTAMVCRHLGQVCGQIAHYAESVTYYRRSLETLLQLGAYEDTVETRCLLIASLVGIGELEQAAHELDLALATVDIESSIGGQNRLLATVVQSSAEVAFAEGDIEGGLRRYQRALDLCGWPDSSLGPGPGPLMFASAALDAQVLHGATDSAATLAAQLIEITPPIMSPFEDLPQIGAVACAIGSYLIATGREVARGLELLSLAPNIHCRQDFPSMRWTRHADAADAVLGAGRAAQARARVAHLRRRDSAQRIMRILDELNTSR
ncbi:BTAD domain-containing putative transcriptional regulator [Nocardia sp. NPDC049190]|uniref:AfsR/SARP family transcriptional regulator n=1 Tax=Nocardia sp. NPDC049190 TaxID=3155650 RepID=UPI0033E46DE3